MINMKKFSECVGGFMINLIGTILAVLWYCTGGLLIKLLQMFGSPNDMK
jgi:hypothetical protein